MTEEKTITPLIRRTRLVRWLKAAAVVVTIVFACIAGVLIWAFRTGRAAEYVRQEILTELRTRCDVEAEFSDLKIDPLGRDVTLTDLTIKDRAGAAAGRQLLAVKSAEVAVAVWPLFYGRLQLARVALVEPQAHLRLRDGQLVDLPACVEPAEGSGAPINLGVTDLNLTDGQFTLDVDDLLSAELNDIGLSLSARMGGGMVLELDIARSDLLVRGRPLEMDHLKIRGRLEGLLSRPRVVVVEAIDLRVGRVDLEGRLKIDLLGPIFETKLTVRGPLREVNQYFSDAPPMVGDARLDISFNGPWGDRRASGALTVTGGRVENFKLGDTLRAQFKLDETGVELDPAVFVFDDGEMSVRGRIGFDAAVPVRLDTRLRRAPLARILDAVGTEDVLANFRGTGRTVLRGTLRPFVLEGPFDIKVRDFVVGSQPWNDPDRVGRDAADLQPDLRTLWIPSGRIDGRWRFDSRGMDFAELRLETGQTSGTGTAFLPFDSTEELRVKLDFDAFDFQDVGPIAALPFSGRGTMAATITGQYKQPTAVGTLSLQGSAVGDTRLGDMSSRVRWTNLRQLDFTNVVSRLGRSRFEGRVGVRVMGDVPISISGRIVDGRIEDLFIPFNVDPADWGAASGAVNATFDLQGPVSRLTGPVSGQLGEGMIYGERWQRGRAEGRFEAGKIVVEGLEVRKHGGRILATGFIDPLRGDLRVVARSRNLDLQSIDLVRASQERLTGNVNARVRVTGSVYGLTGTVSAALTDVRAGPVELGRGRLFGRLRGATLDLTGEGLEGAALLDGQLMLTSGLPYSAKIDLKDVDAPAIAAGLMGHRAWRGNAALQAELSGSLIDWSRSSGVLRVQEARLETATFTLGTTAPADLKLDRGVLDADRVLLGGPQSQLTVRGRLGAREVGLRLGGRIDLAVAELIGPSIEKAGGQLRLDAKVGGSPQQLNLVGSGRVEGGMLKWRGLTDRVTGFTADLTFSQSSVLIDRSAGQFAGGRMGVTGSVLLERFFPKNVALQIELDRVRPRFSTRTVDVSGVLSGQLTVDGAFERMRVEGALDVERGLAEPKMEWSSLVGSKGLATVYDPNNEIVDFDILLRSVGGFRIKNQDADVGLSGSFRFTGTNERMGMLGTLPLTQGGRVVFLGREYTFRSGTLSLTERYRFAPRYDLRLFTESCEAAITIVLVGTLATFELTYRSNPEMDQRDIVSCLIRGVKISELDQDLASFAGSALLKLSGVDQEVKKVLLIDQIEVTTEYSSLARAYEPRVLVAKNLSVLDRPARLEFSTSLLRTNDQRAAVRVRLTPQLNLQLGWTSSEEVPFGDWGLDLKQRWEW